jgi:copper chaperone CopZ
MKAAKKTLVIVAGCVAALTGAVIAETKIEVKKTHICCPACEKAVAKVLDKAGVKGTASKADATIVFAAADDKAAQKVLDDLAAAGFHGDTGNKDVKIKDDSGVKDGKVTKLVLTGAHNCCGACNTAIKNALKKVDGVETDDAKAKSDTITITGNFEGKAAVKALNDAGFHVTIPKEKGKDKDKHKDKGDKKDN